ncbi:presenilin-associated rhomboid-like protein A, mitochondrial isoform X2 [Syngnathoides biaculeatus]|uniref:presenilin-associated rhomboid-like protein A, mitochondrial isoform X2 n=1 Tax=Syngnathoides biaculeatus TaxID=300417 RepID=UPI002ADE5ACF|nr:presenilin-associated rhomboid-like protein A, mitochondrial isoform X2 [Syngnathoides biaculeatus]
MTRLDLYWQVRRGFRRDAKRPEPKRGNVSQETRTDAQPPGSSQTRPNLLKPMIFTVGFTGCSFGAAAILQYENIKSRVRNLRDRAESEKLLQRSGDMAYWHDWWNRLTSFQRQLILIMSVADNFWSGLTEGQRTVTGIILANAVVLCCWKIPSLQRAMLKYFISNPASTSQYLPLVLSPFSHFSVIHMVANISVLWTFSSEAVSILGREQFLAVYASAGVISTMFSYVFKSASGRIFPSLGASGAIMAVVAGVCVKVPDAELAVLFLPTFTFTAATALKTLVAVDMAGLLMGWRMIDHASHIGGALFGIWYMAFGHKLIWDKREHVVKMWRGIRTPGGGGSSSGGGPDRGPHGPK